MMLREIVRVKDVMDRDTPQVPLEATLDTVRRLLNEAGPGPLPVVHHGRLVGCVADRDTSVRPTPVPSDGMDGMDGMRVSDVMTSEPIFCYEDQYLQEARRVMEQSGLHRLPVLGRDRRLVGMLTLPAVMHLTRSEEDLPGDTVSARRRPLHQRWAE